MSWFSALFFISWEFDLCNFTTRPYVIQGHIWTYGDIYGKQIAPQPR